MAMRISLITEVSRKCKLATSNKTTKNLSFLVDPCYCYLNVFMEFLTGCLVTEIIENLLELCVFFNQSFDIFL